MSYSIYSSKFTLSYIDLSTLSKWETQTESVPDEASLKYATVGHFNTHWDANKGMKSASHLLMSRLQAVV